MLHAKVIDATKEKINLTNAQKFIASSKCGASIYFVGTVRAVSYTHLTLPTTPYV